MDILDDKEGTDQGKLGNATADEIEALRECCTAYWTQRPRDSWNITVTEARRPIFENLRDSGYIDPHDDVAALRGAYQYLWFFNRTAGYALSCASGKNVKQADDGCYKHPELISSQASPLVLAHLAGLPFYLRG